MNGRRGVEAGCGSFERTHYERGEAEQQPEKASLRECLKTSGEGRLSGLLSGVCDS